MNILVIAATAKEIQPFFQYYRSTKKLLDVDILITGVGLTATTYHLLRQLTVKKPGLVIQAGIAGCFDKRIPLGSTVVVKKEAIADQGVVEFKRPRTLFDLELVPKDQFPFSNGWLENDHPLLRKIRLRRVTGISINEITTSPDKVKYYKKAFHPTVESMEGAALHYTCLMERVPFIQFRSISNYIAERNKKRWDMKTSILNLNRELIKLIESIHP